MRRSACLLALLGLSVQSAVGQDSAKMGAEKTGAASRPMQFFNGATPAAQSGAAPQRFTRSANVSEKSASDLQNYYNELFGEEVGAPSAETSGGAVVQAEYQADPATKGLEIQQIRAERFGARPFPGSEPVPTPSARPRNSLTQPISVKPQPAAPQTPATSQAAPAEPASGKVTITRANPAAHRPQPAAARSAAVAEEQSTASPAVSVSWRKDSEFNVGQECRCQLVVKNSGQTVAQDVQIRAFFPPSVRLTKAEPAPAHSQEFLGWQLSELKPGEEKAIDVVLIPLQRGAIETRADVRFSGTANGLFAVAEPMLDLQIDGPKQVLIGEPATHTVTVFNPGTGIANNVQIEAQIPEGLEHARGKQLRMDLGSLNPGESRSVRLALAAVKGGSHHLDVEARADSGLSRHQSSELSVIAPSLNASITGPSLRYLGRQGTFSLVVSNDGEAATDNVRVMHKIPSGFEYVSADRGAQFDATTGLLNWFVGRLEKGQQAEIKVTLLARELGDQKHLVRATSEHGTMSDAAFTTCIEGTSSLALQVKDLEDPVEVGSETVYEVRIKNEGTASAKNVSLVCELPAGMTATGVEGPTPHLEERGALKFQNIPELPAGQTVVYKVRVSASTAASLRFRAHLSSESISDPLTAEELTKFYGE